MAAAPSLRMSRAVPQEPVTVTCASSGTVRPSRRQEKGRVSSHVWREPSCVRYSSQMRASPFASRRLPTGWLPVMRGQMRWASSSSGGSPQS